MIRPHIFWIMVDGVRYSRGQDKYARLPSFFEFDDDSISFRNVITSGTSTLMSLTSTFTGRFAVELYPHYLYLSPENLTSPTYFDRLKDAGYACHASIFSESAGRTLLSGVLGTGDPDLSMAGTARETYQEFLYIMERKFRPDQPQCIFVSFQNTSDRDLYVKRIFAYLKNMGLYDEAVILYSSDHGYVDFGRFRALGWALHPRCHTLYIGEDSYRANLNIRLPGSLSRANPRSIAAPVCLIDMFETVIDYLGLDHTQAHKRARSLRPLIETDDPLVVRGFEERLLRVDTRYIIQNYRRTRILNGQTDVLLSSGDQRAKLSGKVADIYYDTQSQALDTALAMIAQRFEQSALGRVSGEKIALYHYNHRLFISRLRSLLEKRNEVDVVDYRLIKKHHARYDRIVAIVDNPFWFMYRRLCRFCRKKRLHLSLYDNYFEPLTYTGYGYFDTTLAEKGIEDEFPWPLKFGIYLIIVGTKLYETLILWRAKENYHPVSFSDITL